MYECKKKRKYVFECYNFTVNVGECQKEEIIYIVCKF